MILVDTNVIVDVLERDPQWWSWSIGQLRQLSAIDTLAINVIVYAELAFTHSSAAILDQKVAIMNLRIESIPREAGFAASKAFLQYRKLGGAKTNVLSDFFIGAHAMVLGCALLTRDTRRYATYFPSVMLIHP